MKIPKGPNMKIDGIDGLHAHLRELFRSKERTDYKNLSEEAKKMFESRIIEAAKKNGDTTNIKLPNNTGLRGLDRVQQIKKMEDFVFMVVGN